MKNPVANNILKDFVKNFNNKEESPIVSQVLATVSSVHKDDSTGKVTAEVNIDNSEGANVPVESALGETTLGEGDRVIVQISDRLPIIIGNVTRQQQQRVFFYPDDRSLVLSSSPDWREKNLPNLGLKTDGIYIRNGSTELAGFNTEGLYLYSANTSFTKTAISLGSYFNIDLTYDPYGVETLGALIYPTNYPNTYISFKEAALHLHASDEINLQTNSKLVLTTGDYINLRASDEIIFNSDTAITFHSANVRGLKQSMAFKTFSTETVTLTPNSSHIYRITADDENIIKNAISIYAYNIDKDGGDGYLARCSVLQAEIDPDGDTVETKPHVKIQLGYATDKSDAANIKVHCNVKVCYFKYG